LGLMKIEEISSNIHIYGAKEYTTPLHTVRKGVPASAKQTDIDTWQYFMWPSQTSHMRACHDMEYHCVPRNMTLSHEYCKGTVAPDGAVSPFLLAE
jgi:hypothetical protein